VQGDARDRAAVERALTGCDAVLSTLGTTDRHDQGVRSVGTENILAAMRDRAVRRLVVMGGFHLEFAGDPGNLGQKLIVPILHLSYGRQLLEDTDAMGAILRSSDLDWTLVRAPRVVRARRSGPARTGTLALGPWSKVTRANVASFMLRCLLDEGSIGRAPMICDRRSPRRRSTRAVGSTVTTRRRI
jgi:putative NADH-flavin reductase